MHPRVIALLLVVLGGLSGCVAPGFRYGPVEPIDLAHQTCVDGALQRNPDPSLLADAVARFEAGCDQGDPAACSLLGLMHERGLSVRQDAGKARSLYAQACKAGNKLGCTHLRQSHVGYEPMMPTTEALFSPATLTKR